MESRPSNTSKRVPRVAPQFPGRARELKSKKKAMRSTLCVTSQRVPRSSPAVPQRTQSLDHWRMCPRAGARRSIAGPIAWSPWRKRNGRLGRIPYSWSGMTRDWLSESGSRICPAMTPGGSPGRGSGWASRSGGADPWTTTDGKSVSRREAERRQSQGLRHE
jgi:hypothetical protein